MIAAARDPGRALAALTDPATRIVTLTVTEKAYGIDRASMTADAEHPAVAEDLARPGAPRGVLGLLTEAIRRRKSHGTPPFTVLCCDNLPDNGGLLRAGVVDFARRQDVALADWIAAEIAFPASMVDRITPAATPRTLADAQALTGCEDRAAVEAELFPQWVIEDRFRGGRPAWEAGGALFVGEVGPYEAMKLRMLNGSHSMLAYAGFLSGKRFMHETVADTVLSRLIARHMRAAAATLQPVPAIDLPGYAAELLRRFANPALAHETYQIAMDGTEKLPQRLLSPAFETLRAGNDLRPFAFAVAAWMRYALGRDEAGQPYALRDPREADIRTALQSATTAEAVSEALHRLPRLFPAGLAGDARWRMAVSQALAPMLAQGMAVACRLEALFANTEE